MKKLISPSKNYLSSKSIILNSNKKSSEKVNFKEKNTFQINSINKIDYSNLRYANTIDSSITDSIKKKYETISNNKEKLLNNLIINKDKHNKKSNYENSTKKFTDEFFFELEKYSKELEYKETLKINRIKIYNIFDNIFRNILTEEKSLDYIDLETKKKLRNHSETWKNFLFAFEKTSSLYCPNMKNPNYINNIDLSTKNIINNNISDAYFDENKNSGIKYYQSLKKQLEDKFTNLTKNEINKIKVNLSEKEKIIENLQKEINTKNSYIIEIQESHNNLKSKNGANSNSLLINSDNNFSKEKNNSSQNNTKNLNNSKNKQNAISNDNILESSDDKININHNQHEILKNIIEEDNLDRSSKYINTNISNNNTINKEEQELLLYDQKQFIRERRLLIAENKSLFEKMNEMEKLITFHKDKEIKLMKVLYYLNKQGIPINDIIQKEILSSDKSSREKDSQIGRENNLSSHESQKSMDSLMYFPITLEKPFPYQKPEKIPILDFKDINSKFNLEYDSPRKSSIVNKNSYNEASLIECDYSEENDDRYKEINYSNNSNYNYNEKNRIEKDDLKNIKNFNTIQNDMDIRTKVKELNNQKLLKEKLKLNINLNNKNLGKIFNIKSNNRNSKLLKSKLSII